MNFKGYRLVILSIFSVAMASFIYSSPVKRLTEFKKRIIKFSFNSEYSLDPIYIRLYSPNPDYKKRSKKQNNDLFLVHKYSFNPNEGDQMVRYYIDLQKGLINHQGDVGYVSKIEFEDSNGIHHVDKEALQLINKLIAESDFEKNIDIAFERDRSGRYQLKTQKKQVGFFVDEDVAEFNPSIVIYGYDSELNLVIKQDLQFMRFAYANLRPYEIVDLYDTTGLADYIARIEVVVFKDEHITNQVNQDTIDAMNNKIKQASEDEVIYFQLLSKSRDRGYSLVHKPDYAPRF